MFAERFKSLREKRGYTRESIAEALGVSTQAIYKYEKGKNYPTAEGLKVLRNLFGVSIDYLLAVDIDDVKSLLKAYNNNIICDQIKKYRDKRNLTQKEFATLTDLTLNEIREIENGNAPDIDKLIKMCSMLDINLDELLGGAKEKIITDNKERKEILEFVLDEDNLKYVRLAMSLKEQKLDPEEIVVGKKYI